MVTGIWQSVGPLTQIQTKLIIKTKNSTAKGGGKTENHLKQIEQETYFYFYKQSKSAAKVTQTEIWAMKMFSSNNAFHKHNVPSDVRTRWPEAFRQRTSSKHLHRMCAECTSTRCNCTPSGDQSLVWHGENKPQWDCREPVLWRRNLSHYERERSEEDTLYKLVYLFFCQLSQVEVR